MSKGNGIKKGKIAIVGAGSVGATLAYNLSIKHIANVMVLIDVNKAKAEAEIQDIVQGAPLGGVANLYGGDYGECRDAEVVVVTAGAKQRPGETRIDLLNRNVDIMRSIVGEVKASGFSGILLIISNPVDILTYVAWRETGFSLSRVLGSGTVLDSSRLKTYLSKVCGVNPINIHGYVLGEHGDTSFPAWSLINIGGLSLKEFCKTCDRECNWEKVIGEAAEYVHRAAYQIIDAKGSTYYAIAQAASIIIEAILKDEKRILPVSSVHENFMGIARTAFSFPSIVGARGIEGVLDIKLSEEEKELLKRSVSFIGKNIDNYYG